MEKSLDNFDDQESKLEEGNSNNKAVLEMVEEAEQRKLEDSKSCDNEKRLYQGRRRHLLRRDRDAAASEAKEEEKEEEKEEPTTRVEESKDSSLSPLPLKSRASVASIDSNDEEKLAGSMLLTSSSSIYLRKPVEEKLKGKFQRRLLTSADTIPEVHFLGEICEGIGFRGSSISCKW